MNERDVARARAPIGGFGARARLMLLLTFAVLVLARMPEIVIKGRFWAEEGKYFFVRAWTMPWHAALLASFGGYLNLVANAATLLARWLVPLQLAPYLTIFVALLFQLIPPALLLTSRDGWLARRWALAASVAIVLLVPNSEEVWLQTLHCQFELALAAGIILALDAEASAWNAASRLGVLLLAPLSGPGSIALLPLFVVRAAIERSWARLMQLAALGLGAALQIGLFYDPASGRAIVILPSIYVGIVFVKHVVAPFLGLHFAEWLSPILRERIAQGQSVFLAYLGTIGFFGTTLVCIIRARAWPALWLLAAGLALVLLSCVGALGDKLQYVDALAGSRYGFAPQALFGLTLVALGSQSCESKRWASRAATCWILVVGGVQFWHPWASIASGPAWRPEVAAWEQDHSHALKIWPLGWMMRL